MELKSKTAIVTGSTGRLGSVITLVLAQAGVDCVCHYNTNREIAEQLVEKIQALGQKALAVQADLSRAEQIEKLFAEAGRLGVPQVLINSAAVFSRQRLSEVTFDEAQRILNLNLIAPIMTSRYFAELVNSRLSKSEPPVAKIINIADVGGIGPWAEYVAYCSSKAGLIGATKALAKELGPDIFVNAVAPGVITWPDDFSHADRQRQLSFIPAKRIGKPDEIADAVIFLLKNDYITGEVLKVDGGRSI